VGEKRIEEPQLTSYQLEQFKNNEKMQKYCNSLSRGIFTNLKIASKSSKNKIRLMLANVTEKGVPAVLRYYIWT